MEGLLPGVGMFDDEQVLQLTLNRVSSDCENLSE